MTRAEEIAHAQKIDTEIARLWGEFWKVQNEIIRLLQWAEDAEGYKAKSYNQSERQQAYYAAEIVKYTDQAEALMPEAQSLKQAAQDYDAEHYKGWPRFFLVKHIHKSQWCSSFRPTTRVGWLPDVSGLTEAEAVAKHGETLCTICYPSAPVALTTKVDPNACAGSGKPHSKEYLTGRERMYVAPSGYCPVCLRWHTITKSGVMRKHKPNDETRRHATDSPALAR